MKTEPKIIRTLLISSLLIAFFIAISTLLLEYSKIEKKVILLANNQVHSLVENIQTIQGVEKVQFNLSQTNFIIISLYDLQDNLIVSQEKQTFKQIQKELQSIDHHLILSDKDAIQERLIHNQIENRFYFEFRVLVKVKNFKGYIKGLYRISDEEINEIYNRVFYSILQLIITVFITTLLLYPIIVYLNKAYKEQSLELLHANLDIMSVLGGAIAKRDNETNAHNYRVTLYSIAFGELLGLNKREMISLIKGAFLHDVGKIGISDSILLKPGKLSDEEFNIMQEHVSHGVEIIANSIWLEDAKDVIAYHHERFDGSGYLKQLVGKEIPLNARIFMICDVFDALTSERPYKEAIAFDKTIEMIKERAGGHFDPSLVPIFCLFIEDVYLKITHLQDKEELHTMLDEKLHYFELG